MSTQDIVQKLWNLCNVLRDDGITYHQYVTELTYILFLKMADETGADKDIPEAYRWGSLTSRSGIDLKKHYYTLLSKLGEESVGRVAQIYANASSSIEEPKNLEKIITEIDKLDWYEAKEEGLGDLYEGLLEKNANEKKSGAGQYFTPRVLIDVMTELIKPQLGDKCFDPACGTFGFMIAANRYVNAHNDMYALSDRQADFQQNKAFNGVELVHETHRLALMNAYLHNMNANITLGDSLAQSAKGLKDFDVILTSLPLTLLFSILHALLCILPCLFIGNRLHRKLVTDQNVIPPRIQLLLFLEVTICSCIFLINIIFGSLLHYPTDILLFNGILIFCFAAANVLIFLMLYNTLQANKKLELQAREQENLTHYMTQLENHYQDIRRFKHDYLNILSTITGYIQENDMDKLRNYFDSNIATSSSILLNQDDTLARLSLIKVTEIKGLLYTKMVQAMNCQLDVSFELTQEITELSTDLLTLSRVLGIFLDNAIEAASETEQKRFHIAIVCKAHSVIFHIENSTKQLLFLRNQHVTNRWLRQLRQ